MIFFSESRLPIFSFMASLIAHTALLALGGTAIVHSAVVPAQMDRSVFLEFAEAPAPLTQEIANTAKKAEPKQAVNVKPSEKPAAPVFKNDFWNDSEFMERQNRMDAKIETIREQIKKLKEMKSKEIPGPLRGFELVSSGLDSDSWRAYLARLRKRVLDEWYPLILLREGELSASEARLDFLISPAGRIVDYKIVQAKGSAKFSEICLEAFKRGVFSGSGEPESAPGGEGAFKVSLFFYYQ